MLTMWDHLELERARQLRSWEEVLRLYPRRWLAIKTSSGRMSFSPLETDRQRPRPIGRMLALVAMEDAQAPEESWASGSMILGIQGNLTIMEDGQEKVMGAGDLAYLGGTRHAPSCEGLYVGLWGIPEGDILQKMADRGRR